MKGIVLASLGFPLQRNDSGCLISVISFGILFQMRMALGYNVYTTVFNHDLGIVKWCRLCDRVSRPVGGLISIMLFRIL